MHCDRRDIARWKRAKKIKNAAKNASRARKNRGKILLKQKPIAESGVKTLRVIKKDGSVVLIEKTVE